MATTPVQYMLDVQTSEMIASLTQARDEAAALIEQLEAAAGDELDGVADSAGEASDALDDLGDSAENAGDGLAEAGEQADSGGASWMDYATAGGGVIVMLGAIKEALTVTLGALRAMTQGVADNVNDLNDMSARTAVSAANLKALKLAAEGSGESLAGMEGGLRRLVQTASDAVDGVATGVDAFAALGISSDQLVNADGGLKSADELLQMMSAGLAGMPTQTAKVAAGMDLMGRSAGKMIQTGALENLDAFVKMTESFGTDIGPQASASAAAWQREVANLNLVWEGAQQGIMAAFGIDSTAALETFTNAIVVGVAIIEKVIDAAREKLALLGTAFDQLTSGDFSGLASTLDRLGGSLAFGLAGVMADVVIQGFDEGATLAEQRLAALDAGRRAIAAQPTPTGPTTTPVDADADADAAAESAKAQAEASAFLETLSASISQLGTDVEGAFTDVWGDDELQAFASEWDAAVARLVAEEEAMRMKVLAAEQKALAGDIKSVGGAVAGALSGNLGPAFGIAAADPIGAAVTTAVQGLMAIGALGAEGVEKKLDEQADNLVAGIEALPDIFGEVLPSVLDGLVEKLPSVIIEAIPDLVAGISRMNRALLRAFVIDLPVAIWKGMGQALVNWWESIKGWIESKMPGGGVRERAAGLRERVGGLFTGDRFASGGVVRKTGFQFLEAGEVVGVNAFGSASGGAGNAMANGARAAATGTQRGDVHFHGFLIDRRGVLEALRILDEARGPSGLNYQGG